MANINETRWDKDTPSGVYMRSPGKKRKAPRREDDPPLADYRRDDTVQQISPTIISGSIRMFEFTLVCALGLTIFFGYVTLIDLQLVPIYVLAVFGCGAATSITFHSLRLYNLTSFFVLPRQISHIALGWTLVFALFLLAVFFLQMGADYSRVWLALWYLSGLITLTCFRVCTYFFVKHWGKKGYLDRRAVIIGGGDPAEQLIKALEASSNTDVNICGIFDDRQDERMSDQVSGYPVLGNISELVEFARKTRIDLLIVSLPLTAQNRLLQILKQLWVLPVDIRLSAHTNSLRFSPRAYSYIGNVPFIDIHDKPITDWDYVAKWLFDKIVALLALISLSPVMALIALAIKINSRGPIFFKQRRYGFNNELIEVYKFRSMYSDEADQNAAKLVTKDDPRVTPVGRLIRKTSLDELPQFINVLRGELSVVGPRPHATQAKAKEKLYAEVVDGYFARHRVKPGITGWAQINGWRGETDTEEKIQRRVEHDLFYIENWSVFFDLYITFVTPFKIIHSENAY